MFYIQLSWPSPVIIVVGVDTLLYVFRISSVLALHVETEMVYLHVMKYLEVTPFLGTEFQNPIRSVGLVSLFLQNTDRVGELL